MCMHICRYSKNHEITSIGILHPSLLGEGEIPISKIYDAPCFTMSIWFREVTFIRLQYRLLLKGHISVQNRRWMNGCKPFPVMGSVEFLWIIMNSSCGDHSAFQNALPFAEEKFCLVMCSPDTLEIFCQCVMVSFLLLWTYLYKATFVWHLVQISESFDFKKDLTHLPFFCHSRSHMRKFGSLIKHSNNDLFIALKVNYSIGP